MSQKHTKWTGGGVGLDWFGNEVMSQTIDLTPTWEAIVPMLLEVYKHANPAGEEIVRAEFMRLAKVVDCHNKKNEEVGV